MSTSDGDEIVVSPRLARPFRRAEHFLVTFLLGRALAAGPQEESPGD